MENRRKEARVVGEIEVLINFANGQAAVRGRSRDISRRGVFVVSELDLEMGQSVHLLMRHPVSDQTLAISGEVVHVLPMGAGIQFKALSPRSEELLSSLIEFVKREKTN